MSVNSVSLSGNLTRDPQLRGTANGGQVLAFGIAVNDRRRNPDGQWVDQPNFVDCVMFGKRAEAMAGMLAKGAKVALTGKLRYSSWERDGQRHSKLEVVVDDLDLMSQRQQRPQQPCPQQQPQQFQPAPEQYQQPRQGTLQEYRDSDLPF